MQTNVLEYLERTVSLCPDKVAYASECDQMTFAQVWQATRSIGSALARRLARSHQPIVVLENRTPACVAAYLGVVASGNCYVPLEASMPVLRLRSIVDRVRPAAVVVMDGESPITGSFPTLSYDELAVAPIDEELLSRCRVATLDTDPLYILFTSGSTGSPKGVVTSHRSLIDYIDAFAEVSRLRSEDVFGTQAPLDYVAAIRDIYLPLKLGASAFFLDKKLFSFPMRLFDTLNAHRVTTLCWVASAVAIPAQTNAFARATLQTVRNVFFTGAVLPCRYLRQWQEALPHAVFLNHYGPTEITASCTYYIVDHPVEDDELLPIGKPFPNTDVLLLDENDRLIDQPDEMGELCVRGCSLALGYYRDAALTEASFTLNPANNMYPERIYRTGDYGVRDKNGMLWFRGRKDSMIKHMGHRIELGEIEATVMGLSGVENCFCYFHAPKEQLCLFVQGTTTKADIFTYLKERLPAFMIPRKLIVLDDFPLLANGKVDRRTLITQEVE